MTTRFINAAGVRHVRQHLADFPRPDRAAADAIRNWARGRGQVLDPDRTDVVVLHHQWRHGIGDVGVVAQKMTLTQAVLANWQGESASNLIGAAFGEPWAGSFPDSQRITLVERLDPPGPLQSGTGYNIYNGLFRQTRPAEYSARTHVQLAAEDFQRFIWDLDFHSAYRAMLDSYWRTGEAGHRLAAKLAFITACNKQVDEGSLADDARRLAWRAAGLENAPHPIHARFLNIYGYVATDLLQITDSGTGLMLLYIPGNASPLHRFADQASLQDWIAQQCRNLEARAALQQHFALADLPDGLDFSGLTTALDGLAVYPAANNLPSNRPGFTNEGVWHPHTYVNYKADKYSPLIEGDLFQALTRQQRKRSYEDADYRITSDGDVTKARWRGYLNASINLLAPLAIVVPELAPIFALGGVAQFGLGLDQAINGKGQAQRAAGVELASFGVLNAAPLLASVPRLTGSVFNIKSPRFIRPRWVNGRYGYVLGPNSPPRLPEEQLPVAAGANASQQEVAPYCSRAGTGVTPLEGADPSTAESLTRYRNYWGDRDFLMGRHTDGYQQEMIYDLDRDLFLLMDDFIDIAEQVENEVVGNVASVDEVNTAIEQRTVDCYYPTAQGLEVRTYTPRVVTHAMRAGSLRAMGLDIPLPIELPLPAQSELCAIPTRIGCIWVGDKPISAELLRNLRKNALHLRDTPFEQQFRLYLSRADQRAYIANLQVLKAVPQLEVLPLEDQPFFTAFSASHFHPQYLAALNARQYASACDVLRYRLLYHEGGLYMDIDDTLLANTSIGRTGIAHADLRTTPDGLVLSSPVSNEQLDMHLQYNNSAIGSHPGNPTLEAISEEMRVRFQQDPGFYERRPQRSADPAGFDRFTSQLNALSGPRLLTEVIAERLPVLERLRHVTQLRVLPRFNGEAFIDFERYLQATRLYHPLDRVLEPGANQSWITD